MRWCTVTAQIQRSWNAVDDPIRMIFMVRELLVWSRSLRGNGWLTTAEYRKLSTVAAHRVEQWRRRQ